MNLVVALYTDARTLRDWTGFIEPEHRKWRAFIASDGHVEMCSRAWDGNLFNEIEGRNAPHIPNDDAAQIVIEQDALHRLGTWIHDTLGAPGVA